MQERRGNPAGCLDVARSRVGQQSRQRCATFSRVQVQVVDLGIVVGDCDQYNLPGEDLKFFAAGDAALDDDSSC